MTPTTHKADKHSTMPQIDTDCLPDVRDGLNRQERLVLYCLSECQKERDGRFVPTVMLYGRVVEHIDMSELELQLILQRLTNYNQEHSRV